MVAGKRLILLLWMVPEALRHMDGVSLLDDCSSDHGDAHDSWAMSHRNLSRFTTLLRWMMTIRFSFVYKTRQGFDRARCMYLPHLPSFSFSDDYLNSLLAKSPCSQKAFCRVGISSATASSKFPCLRRLFGTDKRQVVHQELEAMMHAHARDILRVKVRDILFFALLRRLLHTNT